MRLHQHCLGLLPGLLLAATAAAEPLHLADPHPRWISVQFEVSPPESPGQLDSVYTAPLPAWFSPSSLDESWVVVAIPAAEVEQHLLGREHPVPGSFSDFVWLLDSRTGEVLDAEVSGLVHRRLDFGLFSRDVIAEIAVELTTDEAAGFETPRQFLGQRIHPICGPAAAAGCTLVQPTPFDPGRGYVNAVGAVAARTGAITTRIFSPLGEARFLEREPDRGGPLAAVAAPPPAR